MTLSPSSVARPQLLICTLIRSETLLAPIHQALARVHSYKVVQSSDADAFFKAVVQDRFLIDCLILEQQPDLDKVIRRLHREAIVLPLIILTEPEAGEATLLREQQGVDPIFDTSRYHTAEVQLAQSDIPQLSQSIESAISNFLKLSPQSRLPHQMDAEDWSMLSAFGETLAAQQERLSEKLKERLGYIGVFYKRDTQLFFRNFSQEEQESFLLELKSDYRDIILSYFRKGSDINQQIDAFVHKVFFADMSVSQVLEIHMELMDRLAKKLKLEGRSEDVLLDYRLTLIDAIAHLCEMYRRSIPRESQGF
jgi:circadian clock protein KaiA